MAKRDKSFETFPEFLIMNRRICRVKRGMRNVQSFILTSWCIYIYITVKIHE